MRDYRATQKVGENPIMPNTYEAPRRQEHTLKPTRLEGFALAPAGRSGVMAL
jgi:hypothetical protein